TGAVLRSLESASTDRDGNGTIELSELVEDVTARVTRVSRGRQTPWVARRELFGDFGVAAAHRGAEGRSLVLEPEPGHREARRRRAARTTQRLLAGLPGHDADALPEQPLVVVLPLPRRYRDLLGRRRPRCGAGRGCLERGGPGRGWLHVGLARHLPRAG